MTTSNIYLIVMEKYMAGVGGFEPPHGGIKIRCLTAWLHPNVGYEASFRQLL